LPVPRARFTSFNESNDVRPGCLRNRSKPEGAGLVFLFIRVLGRVL